MLSITTNGVVKYIKLEMRLYNGGYIVCNATTAQHSKARRQRSVFADRVLAVSLLSVVLVFGSYFLRTVYFNGFDNEAVAGSMKITKNGIPVLTIAVDCEMNASIDCSAAEMQGKLSFAGGDATSVVFQLRDISFDGGADATGAVFFIRMPRTCLQGDGVGLWVFYYSFPSMQIKRSEWLIAYDDGSAKIWQKDYMTAISVPERELIKLPDATECSWRMNGSTLELQH